MTRDDFWTLAIWTVIGVLLGIAVILLAVLVLP